jgi:hypothetical protein
MKVQAREEGVTPAENRTAAVRPISWYDALPPSLACPPDSAEAGVMRWAEGFERCVVLLMSARGVPVDVPVWMVGRVWRATQGEALSACMKDTFELLRGRVLAFEYSDRRN